jgi:hypothetical protein
MTVPAENSKRTAKENTVVAIPTVIVLLETQVRYIRLTYIAECLPRRGQAQQLPQEELFVMTYSRRNSTDEQQEACQTAKQITAICGQFHITLDPIDWQQFGMWAPVKVNTIEIASLLDLGKRDPDDIVRQVQIKLFALAALETLHSRQDLKAFIWSPVDVVQPQAFLSLWIITLETDERIPIVESIRNGQRVYEPYPFDADDRQQLATLFGPMNEGEHHLGDTVTIRERDRQYTGEIIYIIPPGKLFTSRKYASRGYHTISGTTYTDDVVARYIVDCNDGFPHIVHQSQVIQ